MKITEKLTRLSEGKNKAELARSVGLKATMISDYIAKGYAPRSDIALKMARAFSVSVDWLIDDAQDWPPPPRQPVAALSNEELLQELGRRMRPVGVEMFTKIQRAQRADWIALAGFLLQADPDTKLPPKMQALAEIPGELNLLANQLRHYDPAFVAGDDAPAELLKGVLPEFGASIIDLWQWHKNLADKRGYLQAARLAGFWNTPVEWRTPWFKENVAHDKAQVAAELAALPPERPLPDYLTRKKRSKP